jgi:hypothetical protein
VQHQALRSLKMFWLAQRPWTVVVVVVGARYRRSTIGRESLMSGRSGRVRTGGPLAKTRIRFSSSHFSLNDSKVISLKTIQLRQIFYFFKIILFSLR